MADLFRKTSLEKLSSPEQLDKMIVITPPSFWIAMAGAGLIVVSALLWSILGRLPVNVETQGIYVSGGAVYSVYSEASGVISQVEVKDGDYIEEGDILAYLDTETVQKQVDSYADRIDKVKAVTINSKNDVVTADNKTLMDLKSQMLTMDQTLQQNLALLGERRKKLSEQRVKTGAAERKMREAEAAYYASLGIGDSTGQQLAYSEAQSDLATVSSYLEQYYTQLDAAEVSYTQARASYEQAKSAYTQAAGQKSSLEKAVAEAKAAYEEAEKRGDPVASVSANQLYQELDQQLADFHGSGVMEQAESAVGEQQILLDAAKATRNNYQEDVDGYSGQKEDVEKKLEDAKKAYLDAIGGQSAAQTAQSAQSNAYSVALSDYNTEKSTLMSLEDAVAQLEVQVEGDRESVGLQTEAAISQFDATKASMIDQLEKESLQYQKQLEDCTLRATVAGYVSNVSIVPGKVVQPGSELAKVVQDEGQDHVVVCYVPLGSGKKVTEGMKVYVYPTTVNKQEYGHMEGTVESVDSYVASTEDMQLTLGNDNLVEAFLKDGPVVAVTCRLVQDETTASGYYWSNAKGRNLQIVEGTMVEASVVTEEKMPISMLIPYIKEKLTIRAVQ